MAEMGKIAVVTGAGSGIGRASALALAEDGWSVALVGRRSEPLEETAAMAGDAKTSVQSCDVSDPVSVNAMFDNVVKEFGRVDLLFNNAGLNAPGIPLVDLTFEQWQGVVKVNLTGTFLCLQAAFRVMRDQDPQGGRIINNGSISAHAPRPESIPYTASKHGVSGITKTAALDGRQYGIAVGQIDVGNAMSAMAGRMAKGVKQANGDIKPEPMMDVAEVGKAVAYMAAQPIGTNVHSLMIMATDMPFVGRG